MAVWHNDTQLALIDWIGTDGWDIAGTLTFKHEVSEKQARAAFRHFWNKVDYAVYGGAARRHNKRCERVCFMEGKDTGNLHWHFMAKSNERRDYRWLRQIMLLVWEEIREAGRYNEITRVTDAAGWAGYISKQVKTLSSDAWDVETTCIV